MANTKNLALAEIAPDTEGAHLIVNENMHLIDSALARTVKSRALNSPPTSNLEDGDAYVIGPNPTNEWQGHARKLAVYSSVSAENSSVEGTRSGNWILTTLKRGFEVYDEDQGDFFYVTAVSSQGVHTWVSRNAGRTSVLSAVAANAPLDGRGTDSDRLRISNGGITADLLGTGAVTTAKVATGAITQVKIADDAVGSNQIADDAIGNEHIANSAVGTSQMANEAITQEKIADDAVGSEQLADGSLRREHLSTSNPISSYVHFGIPNGALPEGDSRARRLFTLTRDFSSRSSFAVASTSNPKLIRLEDSQHYAIEVLFNLRENSTPDIWRLLLLTYAGETDINPEEIPLTGYLSSSFTYTKRIYLAPRGRNFISLALLAPHGDIEDPSFLEISQII